MIDFLMISTRSNRRGIIEIYPKFVIKKSSDLMIRGGDFYAIWLEDRGLWSTDEQDAIQLIDLELTKYAEENKNTFDAAVRVLHMWDAESGMIDAWHKYCQKQMRDSFHMLDEKLIFSNTKTGKKDYASKRLSYPLEAGEISSYDKLMATLYSEEERHKVEWAIGSVVTGDSKKLQKFVVLYGAAGTGKSTLLNIIQQLFDGYYSVFDARALGSSSNSFALESFKTNPLVAIQHDGDLSKIEDNTRLNSLVSHEMMTVNEKFKSAYSNRFKCFLFMGTNRPVKITDAKSGLIRRLIDVSPSGNKLSGREYHSIVKQIDFELGAIAHHCQEVYLQNPARYDEYIPVIMLGASNDFYNFVIDSYHTFKKEDGTTLKAAWEMYKTYCDDAKVSFPFSQRIFKEELKNYFEEYKDRFNFEDGSRVRSYYTGFKTEKFEDPVIQEEPATQVLIQFEAQPSIFDKVAAGYPAQYAANNETPSKKWETVSTTLSDLDTSKLHYVKVPENHIVIDFDITDESGNKSFDKNVKEASKWPPTYAELSKSGSGVHLHYIYSGDVSALSRVYDNNIEVKLFTGNSSLRRRLKKCNNLPIATINSGLPLKGKDKMVNFEGIKNEKGLRTLIQRNLNKEIHPGTKPSIDFINYLLEEAYKNGMKYDVSDMRTAILSFAMNSTNQSNYCMALVNDMHFNSDEPAEAAVSNPTEAELVFFDVEVFPNLFIVCWKYRGPNQKVVRMINPSPTMIESILAYNLIGFNCRQYDVHILYARILGYDNEALFKVSQKIINNEKNSKFREAYSISYTDVLDFSAKKQSLKKFQIELGIPHKELGLPWDEPVPEHLWSKVAEYCDNDVLATEAVFDARHSDFVGRQILSELAGMTVNDTTNNLTARIIFGAEKHPQSQFNYRDLGSVTPSTNRVVVTQDPILYTHFGDEYTVFDERNRPIFPGYKYEFGKSTYRDEVVGEGGNVYAEPGIHINVAVLDIESMHPRNIIEEQLFGELYTKKFEELVTARVLIKHKKFDEAKKLFNGALSKYLADEAAAKELSYALKIAINSVYGSTFSSYENPFRDVRNKDNIVAKRGALFMINLKHMVQAKGFTVAHIKTDSIKIPNATPEIIQFVKDYGKQYGYNFEQEATYEKMCLVNDAVFIAKYKDGEDAGKWAATGAQFAVPYVFKKLFSGEDIVFSDICETKSVTTALYLDLNETLPEGEHNYKFIGKVGLFCPMKPGYGGGTLLRESANKDDGKKSYSHVTGTKGYHWLDSETVKLLNGINCVDLSYYDRLVNEAAESISKYGDLEWFRS